MVTVILIFVVEFSVVMLFLILLKKYVFGPKAEKHQDTIEDTIKDENK
jgi:hypothetical protein